MSDAATGAVTRYTVTGRVNGYAKPHLQCIAHYGTVNPSKRCIHGCIYCYANSSPLAGPKDAVGIFDSLPELLETQLRKEGLAAAPRLYYSTACDAFQPDDRIQDVTRDSFRVALAAGREIGFLTKGLVRKDIMDMIRANSSKFFAQVGIISANKSILDVFEPGAAPPLDRIRQIGEFIACGVITAARLDPIIPGVTDTEDGLEDLFSRLSDVGCKKAVCSYLFTRPRIESNVAAVDHPLVKKMLADFDQTVKLKLHCKSEMTCLPASRRERGYALVKKIGMRHGISVTVCACKNTDIEDVGECQISGPKTPRSAPNHSSEPTLDKYFSSSIPNVNKRVKPTST